jgi:ADP-heptose:LPS heptosyltransferase
VSWRSSNPETGAGRSLPLWELAQVLGGEGRRLVNLQYGSVQEEIAEAQVRCGICVEQVPELDCQNDLDGLAALIMACDEVVSIGNATAHLAGALGQKTTVLLPYSPSWRWMAKGEESPWYQSVRLRRQAERGNWSSVIQAVRHVVDGE